MIILPCIAGIFSEILPGKYVIEISSNQGNEKDSEDEEIASTEEGAGKIIEEEEKREGAIKLRVFKAYWNAIGYCLASTVIILYVLRQGN